MSQKVQVVCDYCGEVKKEANHWFKIGFRDDSITVRSKEPMPTDNRVFADACGHACVQMAVEEFLNKA